jgi:hypothetical protein
MNKEIMETNEWDNYISNLEFIQWLNEIDLDIIYLSESNLSRVSELYTEFLKNNNN